MDLAVVVMVLDQTHQPQTGACLVFLSGKLVHVYPEGINNNLHEIYP